MIVSLNSGKSTMPLPKKESRTASSSPTSAAIVRGGPNLDRLGKIAAWFQADNQGRSYSDPAIWGATLQGRVCNAVLDGKFAANVTGAYSTSAVEWRNSSKTPAEAIMWLNETLAGGMVPYYHFVGSEDGLGEDRRWQKVGAEYFRWTAQHDAHFTTRRSIANIGVVMGQSTQLLYPGPGTMRSHAYMHETTQGTLRRASTRPLCFRLRP